MHSFNSNKPKSKIIKNNDKDTAIINFQAQKIKQGMFELAKKVDDFKREETGQASTFKMDELLKQRTGVAQQRQAELMTRVEEKTIEQLQTIEEEAYKKAYDLGLDEGRVQGLQDAADQVHSRLTALDQILDDLETLKSKLIVQNEGELVKLSFEIGSKIALRNITEDPSYIIDLLTQLASNIETDSEISLKLSKDDLAFVEKYKSEDPRNSQFLMRFKLEEDIGIQNGECRFESNAGKIEATIKDRIQNLWNSLAKNLPKNEE